MDGGQRGFSVGDGGDLWGTMRTKRRRPSSEGRVVPTLLGQLHFFHSIALGWVLSAPSNRQKWRFKEAQGLTHAHPLSWRH